MLRFAFRDQESLTDCGGWCCGDRLWSVSCDDAGWQLACLLRPSMQLACSTLSRSKMDASPDFVTSDAIRWSGRAPIIATWGSDYSELSRPATPDFSDQLSWADRRVCESGQRSRKLRRPSSMAHALWIRTAVNTDMWIAPAMTVIAHSSTESDIVRNIMYKTRFIHQEYCSNSYNTRTP